MDGFELNKIAAAILIAGIIAMTVGYITDGLYRPVLSPEARGYQIEVAEGNQQPTSTAVVEEQVLIGQLMAAASIERGRDSFRRCTACHSVEKDGPNKVGPNLYGVLGANKAHLADTFPYSKAMLDKGGIWTYEDLYHLLRSPRRFLPGTKMAFAGIQRPQEIADLIAYLRTLHDNPPALPVVETAPTEQD